MRRDINGLFINVSDTNKYNRKNREHPFHLRWHLKLMRYFFKKSRKNMKISKEIINKTRFYLPFMLVSPQFSLLVFI